MCGRFGYLFLYYCVFPHLNFIPYLSVTYVITFFILFSPHLHTVSVSDIIDLNKQDFI